MRFDLRNLRFDNRQRVPLYNIYGLTLYEQLLAEGTMLGRDLAVTNTRTGARKSVDSSTSAEVAANVADQFVLNNRLYCFGAMNGAINLVSTRLATDWTYGAGVTVTEPEAGVYQFNYDGITACQIENAFASNTNARYFSAQIKLVSGTIDSNAYNGYGFYAGSGKHEVFDPTTLTSEWQDLDVAHPSGVATDRIKFRYVNTSAAVVQIRFVRVVDSTVAHAAFPYDSVAGAAYGADKLVCSPSWNSTGTILSYAAMYDSSGFPVDNGRIFQAGASANGNPVNYCNVFVPASNAFLDCGGVSRDQATNIWDDSNVHFSSIDWDGVDNGIRYDLLGRTAYTQSAIASDDLDIGCNGNATGDEFHGMVGLLLFNRVLPEVEHIALVSGVTADFATFGGRR